MGTGGPEFSGVVRRGNFFNFLVIFHGHIGHRQYTLSELCVSNVPPECCNLQTDDDLHCMNWKTVQKPESTNQFHVHNSWLYCGSLEVVHL